MSNVPLIQLTKKEPLLVLWLCLLYGININMYTIALILLKRAFALLLLFAFILMTLAFIIECYVLIHVGSLWYQNSILFLVSCVWLSWLLNNMFSIICNLTKWFCPNSIVTWLTKSDKTHFVLLQYDFDEQAILFYHFKKWNGGKHLTRIRKPTNTPFFSHYVK